jgi:hypothetical protein
MTRQEIEAKRQENFQKIEALKKENIELAKQDILLCDETQRFEEKIESHPKTKYQRKPHWLDGKLVGRIFWNENLKDEDTGEVITIERQQIVRVDGEWC